MAAITVAGAWLNVRDNIVKRIMQIAEWRMQNDGRFFCRASRKTDFSLAGTKLKLVLRETPRRTGLNLVTTKLKLVLQNDSRTDFSLAANKCIRIIGPI